ncbi:peptide chain release factor N(5)-glutamine methyltransferase [Mycoplasma nasistruthionis]|uniref:peptide chain release factor N(5)-glutamine methyltransferase n=1 Tax=Mycoplasma nasistruthionis TaxID=353852 RepID=A0A5B7XV15_9MOLU|nr:peptide chain release factor N(5)-glutamine methyltransferase [Mycoplasma nasistruthionis]QCZ36771.1 peptide chain release factor N(5)-glutamine methyltransferase [Mycoplasma nasistruthionis]
MPTKQDLLLEKRRYGLKQTVTEFELNQLQKDTPVQKIIGYIEMADVRIYVKDFNVLIPRYETEELIYLVLNNHKSNNLKVLDLCTGSGFIAISLKKHNPNWDMDALDIEQQAILATKFNAKYNNVDINLFENDFLNNFEINQKYDIIVSNPPYIDYDEQLANSVLMHEPKSALYAPENGFYFYRVLLENLDKYLKPTGTLYLEINSFHTKQWQYWSQFFDIRILKDISGKDRFAVVKFKNT